jgi:hypothetical protein
MGKSSFAAISEPTRDRNENPGWVFVTALIIYGSRGIIKFSRTAKQP